jgi:cytochrome c oxidase cbb3-type subunit 1
VTGAAMSDSRLTSNPEIPAPSASEIDASCRLPLLTLFSGAALWLVLSAVGSMLASMSFHNPEMFADQAWFSYGRILPAAKTWLVYGFGLPAAYGIALWIAARSGRTLLESPVAVAIAAKLWHLGVFIGSFGILCGASTGQVGFEMPRYAVFMLLVAAIMFGLFGLQTIHQRTRRELYPSQWFIITALLWFPWILSTAFVLLQVAPVRGIAQFAVLSWYVNNLQLVTFGLFGIAAGLYFLPKFSGKELYSRHLALFTLYTLVLFGSWAGLTLGGPLPKWMGTLSSVAAVFTIIPALAYIDNTRRFGCVKSPAPESRFFAYSVPMFVLAMVLAAVGAFVSRTHFTLFVTGQNVLLLQGFLGLVAIGGIYHILPKVTDIKLPAAGLVKVNFFCALLGVLFMALPFLFGGWKQGGQLLQPSGSFAQVAKSTLMPIRMAGLGELLWLLGGLCLALNVFGIAFRWLRGVIRPVVIEGSAKSTARLEEAGVKV